MAGTKIGGLKARNTNLERYGKDFYAKLGEKGGKAGTTGGFASTVIGRDGLTGQQRAVIAGKIGGKTSKRGSKTARKIEVKFV